MTLTLGLLCAPRLAFSRQKAGVTSFSTFSKVVPYPCSQLRLNMADSSSGKVPFAEQPAETGLDLLNMCGMCWTPGRCMVRGTRPVMPATGSSAHSDPRPTTRPFVVSQTVTYHYTHRPHAGLNDLIHTCPDTRDGHP